MSVEQPITLRPAPAPVGEYVPAIEPEAPASPNPLLMLHNLLRGRYPLAVGLALLGLIIGAPIGYFAVKPTYRSQGVIEVRSTLPRLLFETEQNERIPDFGPFLITQMELLRSSRVISLAMQDPEWRDLGRGIEPQQVAAFTKSLEVTSPRNSQLIYVLFRDDDPRAAAIAVKAVIRAYERVFVDLEIGAGTPLMAALNDLRSRQTADLRAISERIRALSGEYDPDSLEQIHESKLKLWLEAEVASKRAQVRASLWAGTQPQAETGEIEIDPDVERAQAIEALVRTDSRMVDLQRERLAREREVHEASLRVSANHPRAVEARRRLQLVQDEIEKRRGELAELAESVQGQPSPMLAGDVMVPEDPRIAEQVWRSTSEFYRADLEEITRRKRDVADLRAEEAAARDLLEVTRQRILTLNVEGGKGGNRLAVLSYGETPISPEKDRRAALAAVGGLGLAGVGVGVVLLMGLADRRIKYIEPIREQLRPVERLLGALPEVPGGVFDIRKSPEASYAMNHLRGMLQIRQRNTGHRLIGVTSPGPGEGKTTVVFNLGLTLAKAGTRVLLIDCDFDGGGLTSRLRREFKDTLTLSGKPASISFENGGLHAALMNQPLDDVIIDTGVANLAVMHLGMEPGSEKSDLSPERLHDLFARLAKRFDLILIDTGPILGSVEAAIVASEVQGMVLVVSRGGDKSDADRAVTMLNNAHAWIEGLVFNRALLADVERSVYRSSVSARSVMRLPGEPASKNVTTNATQNQRDSGTAN
jgi:capsular exopolysaccharide synthesis family protein